MTRPDNLVDLSLRQFGDAWRALCSSTPQSIAAHGDGIEYVFSRLAIGFFNAAFVTARDQSAVALADRAEAAQANAIIDVNGAACGMDLEAGKPAS